MGPLGDLPVLNEAIPGFVLETWHGVMVAPGTSEALVATALGLAVAIIALIFYNYFQTRIATLNGLFRIQVGKVLQTLTL